MSSDGYTTTDVHFAAAMMCVYGPSTLNKIEKNGGRAVIHLAIPSLDALGYRKEYNEGKLGITDLKAHSQNYEDIMTLIRELIRNRESTWVSAAWITGRGR